MSRIILDKNGTPAVVSKTFGKRYGRLTSLSFVETYLCNGRTKHKIECLCDCGRKTIVDSNNLLRLHTTSCGCYHKQQLATANSTQGGLGNTIEYRRWFAMVARCHNEKHKKYRNYGGRGITICDGWRNNFMSFYNDVGNIKLELTLERIDNDLGYNCGHCEYCIKMNFELNVKLATRKEQERNKRTTRFFEYNGEKLIADDWAAKYNFPSPRALYQRLVNGWGMEQALMKPLNIHKNRCHTSV